MNKEMSHQNRKWLLSNPSYESAAASYPIQDSNEQYNESAEPKS